MHGNAAEAGALTHVASHASAHAANAADPLNPVQYDAGGSGGPEIAAWPIEVRHTPGRPGTLLARRKHGGGLGLIERDTLPRVIVHHQKLSGGQQ